MARHTGMFNAHGTSTPLLLALAFTLGAAGTAGCDTTTEATRVRTVPDDSCVIDCEPDEPKECVMTHDRWVAKSFAFQAEQGPAPKLDGELCGMSYDDILTASRDTPWMKVAQQYVTARVNVAHGAWMPEEVVAALEDAESWLLPCVPCPKVASSTVPSLKTLTGYNAGKIGPNECECLVDCDDQCIIDCDDDDDLDKCPAKEFWFRAN